MHAVIKRFISVLNVKGQEFILLGWKNIAVYITKKFPKIDKKVKGTTFSFFHFLTIFDDF